MENRIVAQILAQLHQEHAHIAEEILRLEQLAKSRGWRLGGPPASTQIAAKRCCHPPGGGNKATPKSVSMPTGT